MYLICHDTLIPNIIERLLPGSLSTFFTKILHNTVLLLLVNRKHETTGPVWSWFYWPNAKSTGLGPAVQCSFWALNMITHTATRSLGFYNKYPVKSQRVGRMSLHHQRAKYTYQLPATVCYYMFFYYSVYILSVAYTKYNLFDYMLSWTKKSTYFQNSEDGRVDSGVKFAVIQFSVFQVLLHDFHGTTDVKEENM